MSTDTDVATRERPDATRPADPGRDGDSRGVARHVHPRPVEPGRATLHRGRQGDGGPGRLRRAPPERADLPGQAADVLLAGGRFLEARSLADLRPAGHHAGRLRHPPAHLSECAAVPRSRRRAPGGRRGHLVVPSVLPRPTRRDRPTAGLLHDRGGIGRLPGPAADHRAAPSLLAGLLRGDGPGHPREGTSGVPRAWTGSDRLRAVRAPTHKGRRLVPSGRRRAVPGHHAALGRLGLHPRGTRLHEHDPVQAAVRAGRRLGTAMPIPSTTIFTMGLQLSGRGYWYCPSAPSPHCVSGAQAALRWRSSPRCG